MERLSINRWDAADRPREKLLAQGAAALSNAELLGILIGSGTPEESAVALMRRILNDCEGSLRKLGRMSINQLCAYKGIGEAKAISIMAACELGIRRANDTEDRRKRMDSSKPIFEYFYAKLQDLPHEECHVMLLNQNLSLIDTKLVSRGGIASSAVDIRLVLREALLARATNIALCHNHPSGNCTPSIYDNQLTERLAKAAATVDIRLVDHIILCTDRYYSYSDKGKL